MADRAEPTVQRGRDAAPPETSVALGALVLADRRRSRPPGEEWTACAPNGRLLEVWRVGEQDVEGRAGCADALSLLTRVRHPALVPVLAVGVRDGGIWVVSELDAGRPLRRLLAVATLTAEQAALVTAKVVEGLEALHAAGVWHGGLDDRTVHVGRDGRVRLGEWGLDFGGEDLEAGRDRDRDAAVRLLGRLGRTVRRPAQGQAAPAAGLAGALLACTIGGDPAALLARAREEAASQLTGGAAERAELELAVLVGMLEREPAPRPVPSAAAPTRQPHPLRSPEAVWAPAPNRAPWVAVGLVALLLLTVAASLTLFVGPARSRTVATVPHPSVSPRPTPAPASPAPGPSAAGPRPVPALAPAAAGPITAIEIQPLQGACRPGTQCPVQVTIRLQPQPAAQEVRWSFRVFDRCTGATSALPGASVTALAGWAYVYGTSWPALGTGHPLALVAVTDSPAAAASPAVLAGGSGAC